MASEPDWLGASRRAAEAIRDVLAGGGDLTRLTGTRGHGGDATLVIDAEAEAAVFSELDALHAQGARFCALSEERGVVDYGSSKLKVIIDPLDGSTNAKRGLPHHALSIAVADGPTMADVLFGYVYDYGPEEEWTARRGHGAYLDGVRIEVDGPECRDRDGRLELLGVESTDPRNLATVDLRDTAHRLRAIGAIAVTLCQVAAGRLDGMLTLRRTRAVDTAAGQLIVREAGGLVAFTGCEDPLGAPLDAEPRSPMVAARSQAGLEDLARVLAS